MCSLRLHAMYRGGLLTSAGNVSARRGLWFKIASFIAVA